MKQLPSTDWPHGKYVCLDCRRELTNHQFAVYPDTKTGELRCNGICYACAAERDAATLKKELAERKKFHVKARKAAQVAQGKIQGAKNKAASDEQKQEAAEKRAARELASRELARRSLLHFTERNIPNYQAGWVHEDICRRLEKFMRDVAERKSPRLMLSMPPRTGKSELASIQFAAWLLGHHPDWEIISSSYSVDLPIGFSRIVRGYLSSDTYHQLFPKTHLSPDSKAAEAWRTTARGGFRAAGVGGGITGMGAHVLILDDIVKDEAEAESALARDRAWNWYGSTAYTRLAPGGGVLVIGTRWHDDDVSGRLETQMGAGLQEVDDLKTELRELNAQRHDPTVQDTIQVVREQIKQVDDSIDHWDIVRYAAIARNDEYLNRLTGDIVTPEQIGKADNPDNPDELTDRYRLLRRKGEALHPERFSLALMLRYKRTMQPRHWAALYQQDPSPDEGTFFTDDMFVYRPLPPSASELAEMTVFVAWDLAISLRNSGDFTVGAVGALDAEDNLWIVDIIRGRWDTHGIVEQILDTHIKYNAHMTGIEKTALELAIMPQLKRRMAERSRYITLAEGDMALRPITDKILRARPLQGRMQHHRVLFPKNAPWLEVLVHELKRFPVGVRDDQVDAVSWLERMAEHMPIPQSRADRFRSAGLYGFKSWRDRLSSLMDDKRVAKNFMAR